MMDEVDVENTLKTFIQKQNESAAKNSIKQGVSRTVNMHRTTRYPKANPVPIISRWGCVARMSDGDREPLKQNILVRESKHI